MRSRNYLIHLFLLLIVLLISVSVNSQTKRFRPSIVTIELVPSFGVPLPHMYGTIGEFFQFKNYGVKTGVGTHINIKISANKKGSLKPMVTLGYNLFMGSEENAYIDPNQTSVYPAKNNKIYTAIPGSSEIFLHNFRFGVGTAYEFINKKNKWVPYASMTIDMNILFGSYRQDPVSSTPDYQVTYTINSASRIGFSIGGGLHFRASKAFGIMLNMNLRHANLFNKKSDITYEENKMELLDQSAVIINNYLNKDRQMMFFDFGLGFVFFIGRK